MQSIPINEREITDRQVLAAFDTTLPQLSQVRAALTQDDIPEAKRALANYFHERKNASFLFDYRGTPLKAMNPDENPYAYQSSLGFQGSLREFCLRAGQNMMKNIYTRTGNRGEIVLGENFENMPHFRFPEDLGRLHRSHLDMFVRGQFFESIAVLYHENGDSAVVDKFKQVLEKFFETYPLIVVNTAPGADRFQYDDERDIMSVGWLALTYITLLYTELPYAAGEETVFEIIKHVWFLGMQFRRFDTDGYRPYNHHMWERGLVPFILGVMLPEIPDFLDMRQNGAEVVRRHVLEDFNAQGGYNEHSVAYWSGAAVGEMLCRGLALSRLNNVPLLEGAAYERMENTFRVLALIAPPTERYPSMGDNRGPMINPILNLGERSVGEVCCTELLSARENGTGVPSLPADYCDERVGYACCHSGYTARENYLLMSVKTDCGHSGHNHMDMLSLDLALRGEMLFCEPYAGPLYHNVRMNSAQRGYMYNMSSHNTVLAYGRPIVPDEMYANRWGVFRPDSPVSEFRSEEAGCYIEAHHSGYTYCGHRRRVLFARAGAVLLRDEVERGNRLPEAHVQRWHLDFGCTCKKLDDSSLLIEKNGVKALCVWNGACGIEVTDAREVLCPEIYPDPSRLAPVINVSFESQQGRDGDLLTVPLRLMVLDVTEREERPLDILYEAAGRLCDDIALPGTLSELAKLVERTANE